MNIRDELDKNRKEISELKKIISSRRGRLL